MKEPNKDRKEFRKDNNRRPVPKEKPSVHIEEEAKSDKDKTKVVKILALVIVLIAVVLLVFFLFGGDGGLIGGGKTHLKTRETLGEREVNERVIGGEKYDRDTDSTSVARETVARETAVPSPSKTDAPTGIAIVKNTNGSSEVKDKVDTQEDQEDKKTGKLNKDEDLNIYNDFAASLKKMPPTNMDVGLNPDEARKPGLILENEPVALHMDDSKANPDTGYFATPEDSPYVGTVLGPEPYLDSKDQDRETFKVSLLTGQKGVYLGKTAGLISGEKRDSLIEEGRRRVASDLIIQSILPSVKTGHTSDPSKKWIATDIPNVDYIPVTAEDLEIFILAEIDRRTTSGNSDYEHYVRPEKTKGNGILQILKVTESSVDGRPSFEVFYQKFYMDAVELVQDSFTVIFVNDDTGLALMSDWSENDDSFGIITDPDEMERLDQEYNQEYEDISKEHDDETPTGPTEEPIPSADSLDND